MRTSNILRQLNTDWNKINVALAQSNYDIRSRSLDRVMELTNQRAEKTLSKGYQQLVVGAMGFVGVTGVFIPQYQKITDLAAQYIPCFMRPFEAKLDGKITEASGEEIQVMQVKLPNSLDMDRKTTEERERLERALSEIQRNEHEAITAPMRK